MIPNHAVPAGTRQRKQVTAEVIPLPDPATAPPDALTDDEVLLVFEADLDLPYVPAQARAAPETQQTA